MAQSKEGLLRWVEARRAAEEREIVERRASPLSPKKAVERAMALFEFVECVRGAAPPADEAVPAEDEAAYARWAKLRARLARP